MSVSFKIDKALLPTVTEIVKRMVKIDKKYGHKTDEQSLRMDLIACHCNGCPMDFNKLAGADDFTFVHDVGGIRSKIDRSTGKLTQFFLPRCSAPHPNAKRRA